MSYMIYCKNKTIVLQRKHYHMLYLVAFSTSSKSWVFLNTYGRTFINGKTRNSHGYGLRHSTKIKGKKRTSKQMKVKMDQDKRAEIEHTSFNGESKDKCLEIRHLRKLLEIKTKIREENS